MSYLNQRADFVAIAKWISPNSQVLDLGCGDGSFLEFLQKQRRRNRIFSPVSPTTMTM